MTVLISILKEELERLANLKRSINKDIKLLRRLIRVAEGKE